MAALLVFALLAASAAAVTPVVKSGDNLQLWECNPASGRQAWDLERSEKVVGVRGDDSLGWDISGV